MNPLRRSLLGNLAAGVSLAPLARGVRAAQGDAQPPLLRESEAAAKAVHYVEDARRAGGAQSGAACSNCAIYSMINATEGTCTVLPGKRVKAAGWCSAWRGL